MIRSLTRLLELLSPRDKRTATLLFGMMLIGAFLEIVGLAAVPAFVSLVVEPERLAEIPRVGPFLAGIGLDTASLVVWGASALVAVFALKNSFLVLNNYAQIRFMLGMRVELANRLMRAYLNAPYAFHLSRNTAELLRNVDRETNVIGQQIVGSVLEVATRVVVLVAILGFLFVAEPMITLFWGLVFGLCMVAVVLSTSRRLHYFGTEEQKHRKRFVQALYQAFGGIKEARVLDREGFFAERFGDGLERTAVAIRYKTVLSRSMPPLTEFVAVTGLLVLAVALVLLQRPADTILVTMSLFVVALVRMREAVSALMTRLSTLRYSLVSIDPVHADLTRLERAERGRPRAADAGEPVRLHRGVRLENVSFRHPSARRAALSHIDVAIPAGSAVGLVGSTGAGKSTLVDVLLGLLEPEDGAVTVDGRDVRALGVTRWRRAIGYVPQTIYLLDDTIRRNVAFGVPDAEIDEDAVDRAVAAAQLDRFVAAQPFGLDTEVGENGLRVSGGERQRIGIARALYHDPQVLVLDEATSALDTVTERAVIQSVEQLRGGRTLVMIAHRLSTVRGCDRLYYLKEGRVEAQGTFDELQERSREFRVMAAE